MRRSKGAMLPSPNAHSNGEDRASIRRSLVTSFGERYTSLVIQVAATVVLARLLTPEDIGTFSIAAAGVGIAHALRDFGAAGYLLQEKQLTKAKLRTVFGVMLITAWTMAAILAAIGPLLADIYDEPALRSIMLVLAFNFTLIPLGGGIVLPLLRREMNFSALYRIGVAGILAHATTSIGLAALGFGAVSLAWASVAGVVVSGLVARWHMPGHLLFLPSLQGWRSVLSFGTFSTAAGLIAELANSAPNLVIGHNLGMASLGLYSRANGLVTLFNESVMKAINPVGVSMIAAYHRQGVDLKPALLRVVSYVTALAWPFFAVLAISAYPVVSVLLGDQWLGAVPIVRILCLAGALMALGNMNWAVFQGTGAVRRNLVVQSLRTPIEIACLALGSLFGLEAVAVAAIVCAGVYILISYREVNRLTGTSFAELWNAARASFAIAGTSVLVPALVAATISGKDHPWLVLVLTALGAGIGWLLGIWAAGHPLLNEALGAWKATLKLLAGSRGAASGARP